MELHISVLVNAVSHVRDTRIYIVNRCNGARAYRGCVVICQTLFPSLFAAEFIRRQLQITHQPEQCYRWSAARKRPEIRRIRIEWKIINIFSNYSRRPDVIFNLLEFQFRPSELHGK